jgi:HK97 family phage portal protein
MGIPEAFGTLMGRIKAAQRAFVLGPGVVDPYETQMGHDTSTFTDPAYGEYIATSSAVYSCVTLRANLLKGLKLNAYKLGADGKKTEVTNGNLVKVLRKVNPFWTMRRLLEMSEKSLGLWGKNFWFCERGESGRLAPREIWWGRPDRVKIVTDEENYIRKFLYYPALSTVPLEFDPWEVVWFRYGNPLDEFEGLSPMAAARLAADLRTSAMKSNKKLFDQGMQIGGSVFPPKGSSLSREQQREIEETINRRYSGADKAHRWAVFRYEFEMKELGINARDAEFLGALSMTLEEVARVYGIPLDMIGGQRTYENVEASERSIWTRTMQPEAEDLADEITEQLVPMFGTEADSVEFDLSTVPALHESQSAAWDRDKGKIDTGVMTINEWRDEQGLEPKPWGDVWWAPGTLVPVDSPEIGGAGDAEEQTQPTALPLAPQGSAVAVGAGEEPEEETSPQPSKASQGGAGAAEEEEPMPGRTMTRAWVGLRYGSEEHARAWRAFERSTRMWEKRVREMVQDLFRRQTDSVLARMSDARALRSGQEAADSPFNKAEWVRKFRIEMRELLRELLEESGQDALDELAVGKAVGAFDINAPAVRRFMERRAQRFAVEVNETTWNALRESLASGLANGEGLQEMMGRVETVMGDRIRSSSEVIARTEAIGAMNGGKVEAWRQAEQAGVQVRKTWLAELDERTRESHVEAHQRYQDGPIGLDEDFQVGGGAGPAPGQLGAPEEDINCRCTIQPVVEEGEQ